MKVKQDAPDGFHEFRNANSSPRPGLGIPFKVHEGAVVGDVRSHGGFDGVGRSAEHGLDASEGNDGGEGGHPELEGLVLEPEDVQNLERHVHGQRNDAPKADQVGVGGAPALDNLAVHDRREQALQSDLQQQELKNIS
jgi:hypothetical protein